MRTKLLLAAIAMFAIPLAACADTFDTVQGDLGMHGRGGTTAPFPVPPDYTVSAGFLATLDGSNSSAEIDFPDGTTLELTNFQSPDGSTDVFSDNDGDSLTLIPPRRATAGDQAFCSVVSDPSSCSAVSSFQGSDGTDLEVLDDADEEFTVAAVAPEPSSFLLLGTGFLGVASIGRKRFA